MRITFVFIFFLFTAGIEFYLFHTLKTTFFQEQKRNFGIMWFAITALTVFSMVFYFLNFETSAGMVKTIANISFGIAFSLIIAKLIASSLFLTEDTFRTLYFFVSKIFSAAQSGFPKRLLLVSYFIIGVAAIPFVLFSYGSLVGKYDFRVREKTLYFSEIPPSFDNYRIVQISDLHLGSFDNKNQVEKALKKISELKPDVVVFTGDMVNNTAAEAEPYIDMFNRLKAPDGKFSVLGNHDYAHYIKWKSEEAYQKNMEKLFHIHEEMGFILLRNKSVVIRKDSDEIYIAGVENWGMPPFPQHGDLEKTLSDSLPDKFTVLLSHDPTHWEEKVLKFRKKIHLTLSGHTHGMQVGIEAFGLKWSPVSFKYKKWSDLFEQDGKFLYINRGFGFIGYPGRIGIWPEITVLTLKIKRQ